MVDIKIDQNIYTQPVLRNIDWYTGPKFCFGSTQFYSVYIQYTGIAALSGYICRKYSLRQRIFCFYCFIVLPSGFVFERLYTNCNFQNNSRSCLLCKFCLVFYRFRYWLFIDLKNSSYPDFILDILRRINPEYSVLYSPSCSDISEKIFQQKLSSVAVRHCSIAVFSIYSVPAGSSFQKLVLFSNLYLQLSFIDIYFSIYFSDCKNNFWKFYCNIRDYISKIIQRLELENNRLYQFLKQYSQLNPSAKKSVSDNLFFNLFI